jgi:hypothetical protein
MSVKSYLLRLYQPEAFVNLAIADFIAAASFSGIRIPCVCTGLLLICGAAYLHVAKLSQVDALRLFLKGVLLSPYLCLLAGLVSIYNSGLTQCPLLLLPAILFTVIGVIGVALTSTMFGGLFTFRL